VSDTKQAHTSFEPGAAVAAGDIPLCVPEMRGNEWRYVKECLDTGWVSSVGPFVEQLEKNVASYVGAAHGVAMSTGTAALHIALLVAGVKPDDEKATKGIGDHYETEGNTFLKSENWAKAEIMFRRAATLNPKSAGAAAGLARTLLAQGYTEHAEVWSDTALSLQPDLGLALVVRADLRLMAGDQAGAVDLYKQALKTDPGNPRAHQQIFRLTEQK
jgi:tetratricopeptide (TPR) repeat protein